MAISSADIRPWSDADLLTENQAAERLRGNSTLSAARDFLRTSGVMRDVPNLGMRVIWGDVLAALRQDARPAAPVIPMSATIRPRAPGRP